MLAMKEHKITTITNNFTAQE